MLRHKKDINVIFMTEWIDKEGYSTRLLADDKELDCTGCEVQLVKFSSGEGKYTHHHKKKTEFFFILKGNGKVTFGDNEKLLEPGVSFVIRPGESHTFVNTGKEILECIMFKTNNEPGDTYK